jgi:hypothetical protein
MNQIRKEERQFLSDLELLLGKPIPNLDNTDSIDVWSEWPVQPNMEFSNNYLIKERYRLMHFEVLNEEVG